MRRLILLLLFAASTFSLWGQQSPEYLTWHGRAIKYQGKFIKNKKQLVRLAQRCSCETAADQFQLAQKTNQKMIAYTVPSALVGLAIGAGLAVPIAYDSEYGGVAELVFLTTTIGISSVPTLILDPKLKKELVLGVDAFNRCAQEQSKGLTPSVDSIPTP